MKATTPKSAASIKVSVEVLREVVSLNRSDYWACVDDKGVFFEHNDSRDPAEWKKLGKLTDAALRRGVRVVAARYPRHLANCLDAYKADAETGDVLLQCALLGELVYG